MGFDGNNLKLYRKKLGYTQEQIAELIGVSRQALAKWERGESLPDIDNVIALADLFDVSVDSLVRNFASLHKLQKSDDDKRHIFGITRVNSKGQITLPKKCREIFGLKAGNALLVLGDEDKGIALISVFADKN